MTAVFENEEMIGDQLSGAEDAMLQDHLLNIIAGNSDLLKALFQDNMKQIRAAAAVAKNQLGTAFGGMMPGDTEFGVQLTRPFHILRTTATVEAVTNDWTVTLTADGDYWIGYSTNNTTAINIDKRAVVLPLGILFTQGVNPTVEELYFQINGTQYPVQVVRHSWFADNDWDARFCRVRLGLWVGKAQILGQVYSITAAQQQLVMLGLTFASGQYMRVQEGSGTPQT